VVTTEVVSPNTIKVPVEEQLFELIKLIKPEHDGDTCKFLEGYLWATAKRTYNEKLVNRTYWVVNHHLYRLEERNGVKSKSTYWRISGRGNVNQVTKEEAIEVVKERTGYVEDSDLWKFPADDSGEIPYRTATCDW
jgi:hypothetical protein